MRKKITDLLLFWLYVLREYIQNKRKGKEE